MGLRDFEKEAITDKVIEMIQENFRQGFPQIAEVTLLIKKVTDKLYMKFLILWEEESF